jgi:hypothetical protein
MTLTKNQILILVTLTLILAIVSIGSFWDLHRTKNTSSSITNQTVTEKNQNTPPAGAITACNDKASGDTCGFSDKGTNVTGKCDSKPGVLACAPENKGSSEITPSVQTKNTNTTASTTLPTDASSCINNTKDNPQCKDCCDCISGSDSATRTSCRNTCATHDFTKNTNITTITVPSVLGKNGDYSKALTQSTVNACKVYCENSMALQCGDYQHCRMACDNKWGAQPGPGGQTTTTTQPVQSH